MILDNKLSSIADNSTEKPSKSLQNAQMESKSETNRQCVEINKKNPISKSKIKQTKNYSGERNE